jgi:hypothetical protein
MSVKHRLARLGILVTALPYLRICLCFELATAAYPTTSNQYLTATERQANLM